MGVSAAFGPGGHVGRMTDDMTVFIEDILHKAVIEVNEEGTVAASATAVVMTHSLPPPAVEVRPGTHQRSGLEIGVSFEGWRGGEGWSKGHSGSQGDTCLRQQLEVLLKTNLSSVKLH